MVSVYGFDTLDAYYIPYTDTRYEWDDASFLL